MAVKKRQPRAREAALNIYVGLLNLVIGSFYGLGCSVALQQGHYVIRLPGMPLFLTRPIFVSIREDRGKKDARASEKSI